jgi:hypothetical protein
LRFGAARLLQRATTRTLGGMESTALNQRILEFLRSAKIGLALGIAVWAATFYRWVVVEGKSTLGAWPMAVAIPGMLCLLYLGYYLMSREPGRGDRVVGYVLTWTFVAVGSAGALGY